MFQDNSIGGHQSHFPENRDPSPVTSEFSEISREGSEFVCSASDAGSYADSDVVSVSSDASSERCLRSSTKSTRVATSSSKARRPRKRKATASLHESSTEKRKKSSQENQTLKPDFDQSKDSASNNRTHRRKKQVPVKVVSPPRSSQVNIFSRGIKYEAVSSPRLSKPSQAVVSVRKSPRLSLLPAKSTAPTGRLIALKNKLIAMYRNIKKIFR